MHLQSNFNKRSKLNIEKEFVQNLFFFSKKETESNGLKLQIVVDVLSQSILDLWPFFSFLLLKNSPPSFLLLTNLTTFTLAAKNVHPFKIILFHFPISFFCAVAKKYYWEKWRKKIQSNFKGLSGANFTTTSTSSAVFLNLYCPKESCSEKPCIETIIYETKKLLVKAWKLNYLMFSNTVLL